MLRGSWNRAPHTLLCLLRSKKQRLRPPLSMRIRRIVFGLKMPERRCSRSRSERSEHKRKERRSRSRRRPRSRGRTLEREKKELADLQRRQAERREFDRKAKESLADPEKVDEILSRLFQRVTDAESQATEQSDVLEAHACMLEELHHHAMVSTQQRGPNEQPERLPGLHPKGKQAYLPGLGKSKGKMPKGKGKGISIPHPPAPTFFYQEIEPQARDVVARRGDKFYCIACASRSYAQGTSEAYNDHVKTPYHRFWRESEGCPTIEGPHPHESEIAWHNGATMMWPPESLTAASRAYKLECQRLGVDYLE